MGMCEHVHACAHTCAHTLNILPRGSQAEQSMSGLQWGGREKSEASHRRSLEPCQPLLLSHQHPCRPGFFLLSLLCPGNSNTEQRCLEPRKFSRMAAGASNPGPREGRETLEGPTKGEMPAQEGSRRQEEGLRRRRSQACRSLTPEASGPGWPLSNGEGNCVRHSAPQRDRAGDIGRSITVSCHPQSRSPCSPGRSWVWGVKRLPLKTGRKPLSRKHSSLC